VWREREILELLGKEHPFILTMFAAFQTRHYLCLMLEYMEGGSLYFHVHRRNRCFSEDEARFYIAEVLYIIDVY